MATEQQLMDGIRRADAAGDGNAVKALGAELMRIRSAPKAQPKPQPKAKPTSFWQGVGEGIMTPFNNAARLVETGAEAVGLGNAMRSASSALGLSPDVAAAEKNQQRTFAKSRYKGSEVGKFTGNIVGTLPVALLPGGVLAQGAAGGALLTNERTLGGVAKDAAIGAAAGKVGQVVGGAVVRSGGKALQSAKPMVRRAVGAVTGRPVEAIAATAPTKSGAILLKALQDQGMTPKQAAQAISDAQANGVPLALMDTGDEMRALAASLARKPGASRELIKEVVKPRQMGQTERVQAAISRDLGPTTRVREASETLMEGAKAKAAPLYEKAYKNGGAEIFHGETTDLLKRPSLQKALRNAFGIASEEGRDPKALGLTIGKDGLFVKVDKPTWQTWDYIKRGMDDVVESYRDSTTGRLNLDTEGRAVNNTLRDLIGRIDKVNPDYAAARAAYAGPAKMTSALNKGAKVINKDADTIWAEMRDLGPAEIEQYRLGARSALAKSIEGKVDGADKMKALIGTPKKRKALEQLFGGSRNLGRLIKTLEQEGTTSETFGRAYTGSMTALNTADDAALDGKVGIAANALGRAVKGQGLISNSMATLADLYKYGAGKAGERVRSELAAGLSETDPKAFAAAVKAARRGAAFNRVNKRAVEPIARNIGRVSTVGASNK